MKRFDEEGPINEESNIDVNKKNILLIGDSLRIGYCGTTKKCLQDIANVLYPNDNCRNTQYTMTGLAGWCGMFKPYKPNVIQFNCGHWDIAHWDGEAESLNSIDVYAHNVFRIAERIKKYAPKAKVVFALTTAMNPNGSVGINPRTNPEIEKYNCAAVEILKNTDVIINDLYSVTKRYSSDLFFDYCHFTDKGFEMLGEYIAQFLRSLL